MNAFIHAYKPYLVVIVLMALMSVALAFTVDVTLTDEAGIKMQLPDQVGAWKGDELRFCQNPECKKTFYVSQLEDPDVCPECGGELKSMSKIEYDLLPKDTQLLKKQYHKPDGETVFVSIVLSGEERSSIHRPEVCLRGQGGKIVNHYVMDVPLDGREPLKVMVIEMLNRDEGGREFGRYYAYWFVGKDRETPYHLQRMLLMSYDRIFRNVAHRWAYISVSGVRALDNNNYQDEIREVLRVLYPRMLRPAS